MSTVIRIPESVYSRLQALAEPFVDTPATVIERLLDERNGNGSRRQTPHAQEEPILLDPDTPEGLKHTKVREAILNQRKLNKPNWNKIVRAAHELAFDILGSYDALAKITISNIVQGKHEDDGFTYLSGPNFSIQGQSADDACTSAIHLARAIKVPIRIEFEWRNKDDAARPGRLGLLEWEPRD